MEKPIPPNAIKKNQPPVPVRPAKADSESVVPKRPTAIPTNISGVLSERGSRYGKFSNHAFITQSFKRLAESFGCREKLNDAQQEALDMIFHKIGRILNGDPNYADSWIDVAGYSKLVADLLEGVDN